MRRILSWAACLGVILVGVRATEAAKLVILAVNSGNGTVSNAQPPVSPAGARGFLIGIDNTTDPLAPLAFQEITFSGPGLVQRLAPNSFANEDLDSPNVQTRSEAGTANAADPVAGSAFARNDSWWWNAAQDGLTLSPVATGIQGGLPGGPMTMTGSYNLSGNVPAGQWRLAYIVTTADVSINGLLASGFPGPPSTTHLDYETGSVFTHYDQTIQTSRWTNPAGGLFSTYSNWSPGAPGTYLSEALFDLGASYAVTFNSDRQVAQLTIRGSDVTFDLNGRTFNIKPDFIEFPQPSVIESGSLKIIDGTLSTYTTMVSRATLGEGGIWRLQGDLVLADRLTVEHGGLCVVNGLLNAGAASTIDLSQGWLDVRRIDFNNTSVFRVGLGGADLSDFGHLTVSQTAMLGGTLDVDLLDGFVPALGDSFEVIRFLSLAVHSGDFTTYQDLHVGGHLALQHTFTSTSLILKAMPAVSGDINLDGVVNMFDINAVSANWNTAGPQGDANGDGIVNIYDINAISANWGATDPGGAQAVPEPASLVLVCCGAGAMLVVARRRKIF